MLTDLKNDQVKSFSLSFAIEPKQTAVEVRRCLADLQLTAPDTRHHNVENSDEDHIPTFALEDIRHLSSLRSNFAQSSNDDKFSNEEFSNEHGRMLPGIYEQCKLCEELAPTGKCEKCSILGGGWHPPDPRRGNWGPLLLCKKAREGEPDPSTLCRWVPMTLQPLCE